MILHFRLHGWSVLGTHLDRHILAVGGNLDLALVAVDLHLAVFLLDVAHLLAPAAMRRSVVKMSDHYQSSVLHLLLEASAHAHSPRVGRVFADGDLLSLRWHRDLPAVDFHLDFALEPAALGLDLDLVFRGVDVHDLKEANKPTQLACKFHRIANEGHKLCTKRQMYSLKAKYPTFLFSSLFLSLVVTMKLGLDLLEQSLARMISQSVSG